MVEMRLTVDRTFELLPELGAVRVVDKAAGAGNVLGEVCIV